MTTTGTSGNDATLSANLGEHHRHVPRAVAMQMAPIVVPRMNSHQQKCSDTTIEKYIRKSSRFPRLFLPTVLPVAASLGTGDMFGGSIADPHARWQAQDGIAELRKCSKQLRRARAL